MITLTMVSTVKIHPMDRFFTCLEHLRVSKLTVSSPMACVNWQSADGAHGGSSSTILGNTRLALATTSESHQLSRFSNRDGRESVLGHSVDGSITVNENAV